MLIFLNDVLFFLMDIIYCNDLNLLVVIWERGELIYYLDMNKGFIFI